MTRNKYNSEQIALINQKLKNLVENNIYINIPLLGRRNKTYSSFLLKKASFSKTKGLDIDVLIDKQISMVYKSEHGLKHPRRAIVPEDYFNQNGLIIFKEKQIVSLKTLINVSSSVHRYNIGCSTKRFLALRTKYLTNHENAKSNESFTFVYTEKNNIKQLNKLILVRENGNPLGRVVRVDRREFNSIINSFIIDDNDEDDEDDNNEDDNNEDDEDDNDEDDEVDEDDEDDNDNIGNSENVINNKIGRAHF